jgi:conjugative transfer signal peptidase TraF
MFYKLFNTFLAKKPVTVAIYLLIALSTTSILFANKTPLRINLTASMPEGLYWLSPPRAVRAGDLAMVCLDNQRAHYALQRGYIQAGSCDNAAQPLLKEVVALANDTISLSSNSVLINNIPLPHSSTLATDKLQRPLKAAPRGIYKLQANQMWLYGISSNRSWDSRYFGLVKSSDIASIVKPILTW